ncbi:MAG: LysR family transcriptional regulator [Burkholderiales bacterium]|nr:MAG: LysR family transcriptional regulator [Burkholderiales bacterium]
MESSISAADLSFFASLVSSGSLSRAARELNVTTAAVSRRLSQMEARLKVSLLNRTTRRMSLTAEGETVLKHARSILAQFTDLQRELGASEKEPSGLLRVNATLGFGRSHIAPIVSEFAKKFPQVEVRLQLSADPPPLAEDAFDVCIRFGQPPDARVIARKLADNRRVLCASPAYLAQHGEPLSPADLAKHQVISIRQGEEAYGVLRLSSKASKSKDTVQAIKTRGALTTNDGSVAVAWALAGHGIVLRAEWDVRSHLQRGKLIQVLPKFHAPDADIYAITLPQSHNTARVREFVQTVQRNLLGALK